MYLTNIKLSKTVYGKFFLLFFLVLSNFSVQAKSPNIVLIMADDLDMEVFSHQKKIQQLITSNGISFDNHFVSISLCCPSRASILTGQYAHNTGMFRNKFPEGGFEKFYLDGLENSTIATLLQNAGYRTALIGKYLNGYPSKKSGENYIPPGWNYWVSPNRGKPYFQYNYALNDNGQTIVYGDREDDYLDDVLSKKAARFIEDTTSKHGDKPFFIYLAPYSPHQPATPPVRYANDLPGLKAPRPNSFNEVDISDKPAWVQVKPLLTQAQISDIDILYRKRRLSMKAVGDLVENVVNTLRRVGELDNTYIFFTSDNGFHQGQHRLDSGKNTAFEEDIHVPLVVLGPSVPVGERISNITANVDFAPTFANIAGIKPPNYVDGRSLSPFLKGVRPKTWRKVLLLEHGAQTITTFSQDGTLEPPDAFDIQSSLNINRESSIFSGLRTQKNAVGTNGPLTYIEYATNEHELYQLAHDPLELNNEPRHIDMKLKGKLSAWLAKLRNASGQALRNAEQTVP